MRNMSGRRIGYAAPVISTMTGGLRDHYQTTDEERAALIRRNAVILLQREAPAVVAELYPEMIDELHLCPTCGKPRVPFRAGFLKTCGRRDCVRAANGNGGRAGAPSRRGVPFTPERRARIAAGVRRAAARRRQQAA